MREAGSKEAAGLGGDLQGTDEGLMGEAAQESGEACWRSGPAEEVQNRFPDAAVVGPALQCDEMPTAALGGDLGDSVAREGCEPKKRFEERCIAQVAVTANHVMLLLSNTKLVKSDKINKCKIKISKNVASQITFS